MFDGFIAHIAQRRRLREVFETSEVVYARIFGDGAESEFMKVDGGVFGVDGMFGEYLEQGGRVDIIGMDNDGRLVDSVRLG